MKSEISVIWILVCGGVLTGTSGYFTSPGFGVNATYPNKTNCIWTYEDTSGRNFTTVRFSLDVFNVENRTHNNSLCLFDTLDFRKGKVNLIS